MDVTTINKNRKAALSRNLIHIISRNSNWPADGVDHSLAKIVYAGREAWRRFLDLFLLSLGTGFTVAGVIFFFAYNWEEMHPFVKMGIVCVLLIGCVAMGGYTKIPQTAKNTILMGAALLVGALFAVYGQVYQTGADSWELFAVWTVCIAIWVVVAGFAPLWLLFLALVNTTIYLYWMYSHSDEMLLSVILFAVNTGFVIIGEFLSLKQRPGWLFVTVGLFAAINTTVWIIAGIYGYHDGWLLGVNLLFTTIVYVVGAVYSLQCRYTSYLLVIAASIIAILTALLIKFINEPIAATFVAGLFVIGCVAVLSRIIYRLNKQWHGTK